MTGPQRRGTARMYAWWHIRQELGSAWFWLAIAGGPLILVAAVLWKDGKELGLRDAPLPALHVVVDDPAVRAMVRADGIPADHLHERLDTVPADMPTLHLSGAPASVSATYTATHADRHPYLDADWFTDEAVRIRRAVAVRTVVPSSMFATPEDDTDARDSDVGADTDARDTDASDSAVTGRLLADTLQELFPLDQVQQAAMGLFGVLGFMVAATVAARINRFRGEGWLHVLRMGTSLEVLFRGELMRHGTAVAIGYWPYLLLMIPVTVLVAVLVGVTSALFDPWAVLAPLAAAPAAGAAGMGLGLLVGVWGPRSDKPEFSVWGLLGSFGWLVLAGIAYLIHPWQGVAAWVVASIPAVGPVAAVPQIAQGGVAGVLLWLLVVGVQAVWAVAMLRAARVWWILEEPTRRDALAAARGRMP